MHSLYYSTAPDYLNEMTDTEFDVLDELYFVQSYGALHGHLQISEEALRETLVQLVRKGWVKVLRSHDEEVESQEAHRVEGYANYYFLATKAGLLAHNSR
jgi:DNA-binding MarR family transcriptional regulator